MGNLTPPSVEQVLATRSLEAGAAQVSKAVMEFEKWLVAGYAAIFVLAIPKFNDLAAVISAWHLKAALALLAVALILSVFALFMGAQVAAGVATGEELRKSTPELVKDLARPVNLDVLFAEQARGMWWPGSWGLAWGRARIAEGDWAAPGRMVAKLSQLQTYIVMAQVVLGLAAAGFCAVGLIT